ncbi:MAG: cysteine desulfurase [Alphaproteobacteria bacterium]|nr:cysteine desulfurase [Alphaproteobacteria bacterium]
MTARVAYFDWNAGAPLRRVAAVAMAQAMAATGNASSVHGRGRAARDRIEAARARVADAVNVPADWVTFTSGGTEANALALLGLPDRRLAIGATEHVSVLATAKACGRPVSVIGVDGSGRIELASSPVAIGAGGGDLLVSVQLANNETGVIQDIASIAGLVHAKGGLLHVDAAQALGRVAVDMPRLGADLMSLSAHKLGGPTGVGALVASPDLALAPLWRGGSQEGRRRAGTENVAGIVGFAAALEEALGEIGAMTEVARLRDVIRGAIAAGAPDAVFFGEGAPRLPNTLCLAMPGVKAETQVIALDLAGIAVSAGAACSSGAVTRSHVLEAMGVSADLADGAIRVSLGRENTTEEAEHLVAAWGDLYMRTRARAAA